MKSRSLGRNLKQCEKLILFGATLGTGADRLITRASLTDMAKAVVLQACAAAMLEEYCDACQREIAKQQEKEGLHVPPFLIASIASQCNLHCAGCYARAGGGCGPTSDKSMVSSPCAPRHKAVNGECSVTICRGIPTHMVQASRWASTRASPTRQASAALGRPCS